MTDYETLQRRRNITVGIFVFIALCALVWLIFMFNELPTTVTAMRSFQIFVQFPTAQGVQEDTPVQFCGYQIGRVTAVMPPAPRRDMRTGKTYHQTMCILSIDRRYKNIPSNVDIKVMRRGLGSSYIEMTVDPDKEPTPLDPNRPETIYLVDNLKLQGSAGTTSEFFPAESQEKLDKLVENLSSLINNANNIIGDKTTRDNIKQTLANLAEASKRTNELLKKLQEFAASGTQTSEELAEVVSELRLLTQKINNGQGTIGRLVNDGQLYENLLEDTEQLQELLGQLKTILTEYREKGLKVNL